MTIQFQADPRAVAAGLMLPQEQPGTEPRFTDAGLFAMVGAMAYSADNEDEVRLHNLDALVRVLSVARDGGLEEHDECLLLELFAEGVNPLDQGDKGKLLAVICRCVALWVGPGRMVSLVQNSKAH